MSTRITKMVPIEVEIPDETTKFRITLDDVDGVLVCEYRGEGDVSASETCAVKDIGKDAESAARYLRAQMLAYVAKERSE